MDAIRAWALHGGGMSTKILYFNESLDNLHSTF